MLYLANPSTRRVRSLPEQGALFDLPENPLPDLASYRWILANLSGGKDSQTMLRRLVAVCDRLGIPRGRIVCVYADLGRADEWPGTEEIARYHAGFYGLRFVKTWKRTWDGETQGLFDYIVQRGMWPDAQNRFCTSDAKRGPISRVLTRLADEARAAGHEGKVRILNVMGMRGEESPKRARMAYFGFDKNASNSRRHVDNWLPIHAMTEKEVWADIKESGVRHHWAYDSGMPRLSCMFCVLASRKALVRAAQLNPEGARLRAAAEDLFLARRAARLAALSSLRIRSGTEGRTILKLLAKAVRSGHTFQQGTSMHGILAEAEAATRAGIVVKASNWEG